MCYLFPFFISTSSSRTTSFHCGGKLALAFPLAEAPAHLMGKLMRDNFWTTSLHSGGNTSTFQTTSLHGGGKLARANFPSCTCTSVFQKTTFHCGGKLVHASFPSCTSTNTFQTTTFHCGKNLECASFPSFTNTSTFQTTIENSCINTNASAYRTTSFYHGGKLARQEKMHLEHHPTMGES